MTTTTQDAGATTQSAGGEQNAAAAGETTPPAAGATTTQQPAAEAPAQGAQEGEQKPGDAAAVEYEVTAPEGIELDAASVDQFKAIAKELNLPKDKAEQLAAIAVKREVARREAFAQQVTSWGDAVMADPELGKPENLAIARKAIDAFGTPELKTMLNASGLGNHPEVVRMALAVGKRIAEDTFEQTNRTAAGAKSLAERMYPTAQT